MVNSKKKGFTVIELVIVIAVIAVLAAVLIPTFSSLIKKTKIAADIQTVRNLNTIVASEGAAVGGIKTAHDAIVAASNNGYDVTYISPTADGRTIAWDGDNSRFVLLDNGSLVFPNDKEISVANTFIVRDEYSDNYEEYNGYGIYLKEKNNGEVVTLSDETEGTTLTVSVGLDVGYNEDITSVTYTGSEEVIIRTNSQLCIFVMTSGIVNHYGVGLKAVVKTVKEDYRCYAEMMDKYVYISEDEATAKNNGFAGGDGSKENPYLVASSKQLANIAELSSLMEYGQPQYIKLVSDIKYEGGTIPTYFNGELDGAGHSITYKGTTGGWPSLFQGTCGDTVIKDLDYVCDGLVKCMFAYVADKPNEDPNGSNYGTTIFQNVVAKATTDDILSTWGYGCSPFCYLNNNIAYFKNCVNEINYAIAGGDSYGGIFIGNYSNTYTYTSFENCVNKGTVNGAYVGFFIGNTAKRDISLVDENVADNTSKVAKIYVNNCKNEGYILGAEAVSAFGCNSNVESHTLANTKLSSSQFSRGTMVAADINVELLIDNNNNIIKVIDVDNEMIVKYSVTFSAYITLPDDSGSNFSIEEIFTVDQVRNGTSTKIVSSVISKKQFEENGNTFSDYEAKTSSQFRYIIVENSDGSRTIVVDLDNFGEIKAIGTVDYAVTAYDSNGFKLGYKKYNN